jgi:hypothetical protein
MIATVLRWQTMIVSLQGQKRDLQLRNATKSHVPFLNRALAVDPEFFDAVREGRIGTGGIDGIEF